ncbi:hypothetical protein F5Y13DRAFT_153703 [Hypoxylon sp. FL1857]|nr:hypothetical protein F5Y13DRAFT_153703 [Hypoxylon sp. FL1857]
MHAIRNAILTISLAVSVSHAYDFGLYRDQGCRGEGLGHVVAGPNQGCMTHGVGTAQSFTIKSTGPVDNPFMVVMYSSGDCNPDTIIGHSDGTESKCLSVTNGQNYGSFEVWDLSQD